MRPRISTKGRVCLSIHPFIHPFIGSLVTCLVFECVKLTEIDKKKKLYTMLKLIQKYGEEENGSPAWLVYQDNSKSVKKKLRDLNIAVEQ